MSIQQQYYKVGVLIHNEDQPFIYTNAWSLEKTTGPDRLAITAVSNHVELLKSLYDCLNEPFEILYVLVVSRGEATGGRYQNAIPASREETGDFLKEFRDYLEKDGRHHLWLISLTDEAMLVYDNHNIIYAYGPLDRYVDVLRNLGFIEQTKIEIPSPHTHHYNEIFDGEQERILSYWEWSFFPLRDSDR